MAPSNLPPQLTRRNDAYLLSPIGAVLMMGLYIALSLITGVAAFNRRGA
ncbi:hypothetical protein HDA45_000282 [Amycolatopsis umgeniensis]|uniref:ABC transporter permease n=1 Tax=Amycolatopsis umgeniensis TaxID=336628 RepID=A0A841AUZ5_9PSEU|nr:hypothetical protein [Amycolatopsis umgeniensis]